MVMIVWRLSELMLSLLPPRLSQNTGFIIIGNNFIKIVFRVRVYELEKVALGLILEIREFPRPWKQTVLFHGIPQIKENNSKRNILF